MEVLTNIEKERANALLQSGYNHAANSFQSMVGQKVEIKNESIEVFSDALEIKKILDETKGQTVLLTELIGDLHGESYLIFTQEERKLIYDMCIKIFSGGSGAGLDEEIILKEVDNILSAAVVTEFSNQLKIRIFGDVPKLYNSNEVLEEHLFHKHNGLFLVSDAHFVFENHVELKPKFLWKLDEYFLELIREPKTV